MYNRCIEVGKGGMNVYKLIRSRYDGLVEIVEEVARGSYEQMKNWSMQEFNGGSYVDGDGYTWYTEILKVEEEEEMANREVRRININIPVDALEKIDEYADKMCVNRTSAILFLVNQSLDAQKNMNTMEELLKAVKTEQAKGN